MADTMTLPSTTGVLPLTTEELMAPDGLGIIKQIVESVSTQPVDIDFKSSTTQEVILSNVVELEVEAPTRKQIERALGKIVGGRGFAYKLPKPEGINDRYTLRVFWRAGTINLVQFATLLQEAGSELVLYSKGVLITLDEESIAIPAEF